MRRLKDNRHGITKSAAQFFTHDYNKRRRWNFGSQLNQNFNQQPRYGNQNNQTPIDKLASTQIGTEIQTHIDSITEADQATPGTTDQMTVSRLSITSMLNQRTQTLITTKTFPRATTYPHATQFNSSTIRNNM